MWGRETWRSIELGAASCICIEWDAQNQSTEDDESPAVEGLSRASRRHLAPIVTLLNDHAKLRTLSNIPTCVHTRVRAEVRRAFLFDFLPDESLVCYVGVDGCIYLHLSLLRSVQRACLVRRRALSSTVVRSKSLPSNLRVPSELPSYLSYSEYPSMKFPPLFSRRTRAS